MSQGKAIGVSLPLKLRVVRGGQSSEEGEGGIERAKRASARKNFRNQTESFSFLGVKTTIDIADDNL